MNQASAIVDHLVSTQTLFSTQMVTSMAFLLTPIFTTLNPYWKSNWFKTLTPEYVVKKSFYYSLLPMLGFLVLKNTSVTSMGFYVKTETFVTSIGFCFDKYSVAFIPVAMFVTWSIIQFSQWYMKDDPNYNRFMKLLLIFLCAMILLVSSNNFLPFFVGWEGVGTMSFLLIGWWSARPSANIAALSAIMINRYGDIGMVISMLWLTLNLNSWDFSTATPLSKDVFIWPIAAALLVSSAGKSAQFGFHPWLPAAMEGPTPVSALLHSSTMVIAGVFLALRAHPLLVQAPGALTVLMWLGAITTLYAATYATVQNDIKKIIAYSTSSQLGLMMVAIGLNQPNVAFSHLCAHSFFKAMLFMCAGTFIHSLNNEQDIRKMGGLFKLMPITCSCFIIGNLALAGAPFLAGFFSKDAIIETLTMSPVNSCAMAMTVIATSFTAVYSMRMIYFVMMRQARTDVHTPIDEGNPLVVNPLIRLAWGSIIAGGVISWGFAPLHIPVLTLPLAYKLAALLVSIAGLLFAKELTWYATNYYPNPFAKKVPSEKGLNKFHQGMSFYPTMFFLIRAAEYFVHWLKNKLWAEKKGPEALAKANKVPISAMSNLQQGHLMAYIGIFLLTLAFLIIVLYK